MASKRHATSFINRVFICVLISLLIPIATENVPRMFGDRVPNDDKGRRLTREYDLRQGALRGLIVKPNRLYNLQSVEMFLGIPYAAPPVGNFRFMPPASAPSWPGVLMATRFAPVCPQNLPPKKKGDPPSLGRQRYMERLEPFLEHESEDCLYLNIYVPYREKKSKNFPVLVFIHGDSFEWSSGNPYDGRILASYGNVMVITINYRLGILGFLKPSMTEYVYNNNGILDQLAALQWIKDNIQDLNGDPNSVTLMGHGTGAACVSFLMLSPISNGLFHRAILMSGSALSDWALTKDPTQYTLQVAQSLGCNPKSEKLMACLQSKSLADIRKVQILAREFETPLGAVVAGAFIPDKPLKIMSSYPNLLSKYQLLCGVTEYEAYHDFGAIELEHGILETQRDELITKYANLLFEGGESVALTEILKQYSPSKMDPQRWNVETNRDVILNVFSDARTLSPLVRFANYHSKSNRQCYFYVFGHNSVSTHYAPLNKSVQGEELPYIFGVPLGGTNTHFHSEYTSKEKILSESIMRLWTNFVKIGTPNTQSVNEYLNLDKIQWDQYNIEWPEYNVDHQSYLRLGIPPHISSLYRSNYSKFWIDYMPNKMKKFIHDPLYELTSFATTQLPKTAHKSQESIPTPRSNTLAFGRVKPFYQAEHTPNIDAIYRKIQSIKTPLRTAAPSTREIVKIHITTAKPKNSDANIQLKTSSSTITLIVTLGILFLAVNIAVCAILWLKKKRINLQENNIQNSGHTCTEIEDVNVMRTKNRKEDINSLQTLRNSCNAFKSMSISKIRANHHKNKKRQEVCKTPKSDDSGGFKERFQLRRHLSTSTLDAHTKVRDWIANEVMHRCSPNMMHKIDPELDRRHVSGPFTRSEELLSDTKNSKCLQQRNSSQITELSRIKNSEKTSTLALGSTQSTISSKNKSNSSFRDAKRSTDSLKSKGAESTKSKGVSVAIDATPSARTNSILQQQPIELSKSFDGQRDLKIKFNEGQNDDKTTHFTNEVTLSLINEHSPVKVFHKHSNSDPVTNVNYEEISNNELASNQFEANILPSVIFRNEIKDSKNFDAEFSATSDALLTIKRRNFPKVLPDLPKSQKRLSLQTATLQTFRGYTDNNDNGESDNLKIPPTPPPRTTTLDRRLDYKRSNQLSSFENSEFLKTKQNYENVAVFTSNPVLKGTINTYKSIDSTKPFQKREYPKVIIASSNFPNVEDPKLLMNTSLNQGSSVPRVKVSDNFHFEEKDSFNAFLSNYSDGDDNDLNTIDFDCNNDKEEDNLILELVGGVSSSTHAEDTLDSKGPSRMFEKELEIIPVKVNTGYLKSREDYVCVTDLQLPDINDFEKTAQIKPNYGINKLQQRSKGIQKPPEKAIKIVRKGFKKTSSIFNQGIKNTKKGNTNIITDQNEIEYSNSGSSNDTEESTGTVKQNEIIKK